MTGDLPAVPRKFRLASRDRNAMREQVGRILGWPTEKIVMAHGRPVRSDGHAALQAAFRWLGPGAKG